MCFKRFTAKYVVGGGQILPPPGWNRVKMKLVEPTSGAGLTCKNSPCCSTKLTLSRPAVGKPDRNAWYPPGIHRERARTVLKQWCRDRNTRSVLGSMLKCGKQLLQSFCESHTAGRQIVHERDCHQARRRPNSWQLERNSSQLGGSGGSGVLNQRSAKPRNGQTRGTRLSLKIM